MTRLLVLPQDSVICSAGWLNKALVYRSIVGREVVLEEGVQLDTCIILDYVKIGKGSRLRRVIVDKQNVIEADTVIGFDREKYARQYFVDASGITVVPRGNRPISLTY